MYVHSVVYEPRDGYPLHLTAKRYRLAESGDADVEDPEALTLILLHSTSFYKEAWEPTIERIFELVAASKDENVKIREAWAIDCPNHGASAELNELALQQPEYFHNFTCEKYAIGVHHFLSAGCDHGAKVDFSKRQLVGIGHSLGGVAMTILQQREPLITFSSIILVEPMLSPAGSRYLSDLRKTLIKIAYERRDVWPSRQNALEDLRTRPRTAAWHPRIVELFVEHGLRSHPGSRFPDTPYDGVTLACTRDQEAAMYRDVDGPTKPVADLNWACANMPVHVVFGDKPDFLTRDIHDAVTDPSSGRKFASITRIPNCGHLVPQCEPVILGNTIFAHLTSNAASLSRKRSGSRL